MNTITIWIFHVHQYNVTYWNFGIYYRLQFNIDKTYLKNTILVLKLIITKIQYKEKSTSIIFPENDFFWTVYDLINIRHSKSDFPSSPIQNPRNPLLWLHLQFPLFPQSIFNGRRPGEGPGALPARRRQQPWRFGRQAVVIEAGQRYLVFYWAVAGGGAFPLLGRASVFPRNASQEISPWVSNHFKISPFFFTDFFCWGVGFQNWSYYLCLFWF